MSDKKYYLDFVPKTTPKTYLKKHECLYDSENYKWYTLNKNNCLLDEFSKVNIDFWAVMNEFGIAYDKNDKAWYTNKGNNNINKKFEV